MATKSWGNVRQLSNHARVLRYIFRNQPVSRSEIGQDLNLPRSMVTGITARLIEQDIVRELGKADTQEDGAPGRRRQLLGICPDARFAVGAEIGVRHFRFCLTVLAGHVLVVLCYAPTEEQIRRVKEYALEALSAVPGLVVVSPGDAPHICAVSLPGYPSEMLVRALSDRGICVSSGSACHRGKPSHVFAALGLPKGVLTGVLRISFSPENTFADADALRDALLQITRERVART